MVLPPPMKLRKQSGRCGEQITAENRHSQNGHRAEPMPSGFTDHKKFAEPISRHPRRSECKTL